MRHTNLCRFYCLLFCLIGLSLAKTSLAGAKSPSAAERMLAGIDEATWVEEGQGPRVVYVFFDPNCPYCHQVYVDTRDYVKRGEVRLRWVPVGVLTTTSFGKAAAILDAKDPLQAFHQNEDHYQSGDGGAVDEALEASEKADKALAANARLLRFSGFDAVPSLLFRAKGGEAVLVQGAPPAAKLKRILEAVE